MRTTERGGALLAVLWLSAALAAIAFSVAATVRSETERASTNSESTRAYYLAAGGVHRAMLWMYWGMWRNPRNPDGTPLYYSAPMPRLVFNFPTGVVNVDVIPEAGKLNVNTAQMGEIDSVLRALGIDSGRSQQIAAGIIDWRTLAEGAGAGAPISAGGSSFQARHASLEELEELLLVPGMTPDIFYGRYDHDPSGRLIPRGGLRDCLTVWGGGSKIDPNTAPPALLEAAGIPEHAIAPLMARRAASPFSRVDELSAYVSDPAILGRFAINGYSLWTLRATARVRMPNGGLSEVSKTVAAVIKLWDPNKYDPPFHVLRWYDDAWTPVLQGQ